MHKDMELWLQSLHTEEAKREGGTRLRKLIGLAMQSKDTGTAVALGGLAARYGMHAEGLYYIFASALLADGRPFSARVALQKELRFFPACQRSNELLRELEAALQGMNLPENPQHAALSAANLSYANRHLGQRCFILGNAPSLKNHDLTLLRNDVVISVSHGYLHPDYAIYKPQYHCLPRIPYAETALTPEHTLKWFAEMDARTGNATLALSGEETTLLREHGTCPQRDILSVNFSLRWDQLAANVFDLCGPVAGTQSVPIMTLYLALFMGFKEVYMLGVDHNEICNRKYVYFYEKSINTGLEGSVDAKGNVQDRTFEMAKVLVRLFGQYEEIKNAAERREVAIFNANPLGLLDTFPRVRYEELF